MDSNFFYSQIERKDNNREILNTIKDYVNSNKLQSYAINRPLGEGKYNYEFDEVVVLLIPGYKIMFFNLSDGTNDEFEYYRDDFIEDLGYISDKYDYKEVIGRPRDWKRSQIRDISAKGVTKDQIIQSIMDCKIEDSTKKRISELLISLLIGSINSIDKVGIDEPQNLLDKVKQKIVLFDGDQTRFIFEKVDNKRITIQGLAGTGKTELLLHKLKELYVSHDKPKIAFTCHSKTLANNLKKRIPDFFTFMRVDEQIQWNDRLWVYHSWGSGNYPETGLYAHLCAHYDIPFQRWSYATPFKKACADAIAYLTHTYGTANIKPLFDYILIDESQDFPEEFFELCEMVTKTTIYIAGDIFQNIFDNDISKVSPDFLLNKCYRTDPRTLMFAHAVGLALYERPVVTWLDAQQWEACGYSVEELPSGEVNLSREKIRRFEDIDNLGEIQPLEMRKVTSHKEINSQIISAMNEIIEKNPTAAPNDIGIVFIDESKAIYSMIDSLEMLIYNTFSWEINRGFENKGILDDTVFVSNRNNVKGLEFPFLICVVINHIEKNVKARNTLYMTLTRSFISSYLVMSDVNSHLFETWEKGLAQILTNNFLQVIKPHQDEIMSLEQLQIDEAAFRSRQEIIEDLFEEYQIPEAKQDRLNKVIDAYFEDHSGYADEDYIRKIIESNKNL